MAARPVALSVSPRRVKRSERYIECLFSAGTRITIDVKSPRWVAVYRGVEYSLDWNALAFPAALKVQFQAIVARRMVRNSPRYLSRVELSLRDFLVAAKGCNLRKGFSSMSISDWIRVWTILNTTQRSTVRALYLELAEGRKAGADLVVAREMQRWKARDVHPMSNVLRWDQRSGALTSAEMQVVRSAFRVPIDGETDEDCAVRMIGWILLETLKRAEQVLSMEANALHVISAAREPIEYFLSVPKAKAQSSRPSQLWQVSEDLGRAIQSFSGRPRIKALQRRFNRLLVVPIPNKSEPAWTKHGQVSGWLAGSSLREWIKRRGLTSSRTSELLHVTPLRIRHTGATQMAMQGVARETIQEILEHDSPFSAQAYIDAVGSELLPALERADRSLGEQFKELRGAFFNGAISSALGKGRLIQIPIKAEVPAIVGRCGKDGRCRKHPFIACYDGCHNFVAWKEADHRRALSYVEDEFKRWSRAEGGKEKSKLVSDFSRVAASIREVIANVERSKDP